MHGSGTASDPGGNTRADRETVRVELCTSTIGKEPPLLTTGKRKMSEIIKSGKRGEEEGGTVFSKLSILKVLKGLYPGWNH